MIDQPRRVTRRQRSRGRSGWSCVLAATLLMVFLVGCAGVLGGPVSQAPTPTPTRASFAGFAQPPTPTPTATPFGLDGQQPQILANLGHPAQAILVSIDNQTVYVYQHDTLLTWSSVTTGRPELQTPRGYYHVTARLQSIMFYSKWPPGSPYYYAPVHVNYAVRFLGTDFFLHDYSARNYYGPGTNVWHQNPDGTWETGSHGCVETPLDVMQWLFNWVTVGAPVVVY
jgi:lipoprotein-anchoring transpeptidase ErfK/SrfK